MQMATTAEVNPKAFCRRFTGSRLPVLISRLITNMLVELRKPMTKPTLWAKLSRYGAVPKTSSELVLKVNRTA